MSAGVCLNEIDNFFTRKTEPPVFRKCQLFEILKSVHVRSLVLWVKWGMILPQTPERTVLVFKLRIHWHSQSSRIFNFPCYGGVRRMKTNLIEKTLYVGGKLSIRVGLVQYFLV